jgi:glycosyltransferase involved in cell wall biosynthesis
MLNTEMPDLLCFSHLRWNFVFQRPQHLMIRYPGRVFFIEEPVPTQEDDHYDVVRSQANVWLITPRLAERQDPKQDSERLRQILDRVVNSYEISEYISWYYSPMALKFSDHLCPIVTVYDCMDELSAFKFAPPELKELEMNLMARADLVFTGGNKLFEAKKKYHHNMYAFPSSIDKEHFRKARNPLNQTADQSPIPHPRLGFFGVIDERLDIKLLDELARMRPDWNIILIGPVVKIDPASLPLHPNIYYLGAKKYDDLPAYLAGWDIAIMPFAINESTEFISPTKTPEYLCGGKPVISTPISDVVNDYGKDGLVSIAANAGEFVLAAEQIFGREDTSDWLARVDERLANNSWDITWEQMMSLITSAILKRVTKEIILKKELQQF